MAGVEGRKSLMASWQQPLSCDIKLSCTAPGWGVAGCAVLGGTTSWRFGDCPYCGLWTRHYALPFGSPLNESAPAREFLGGGSLVVRRIQNFGWHRSA